MADRPDLLVDHDARSGSQGTPAQVLAGYMSDLSEDYYCAGWLIDCEHRLWGMVEHGDRRGWGGGEVTDEEITRLRELSNAAGGWVAWREGSGATFVPMGEWRREADAYRAETDGEEWADWQRGGSHG